MTDTTLPPTASTIPLSAEQCREALIRLQQYARWMYHAPEGVAAFRANRTPHAGREFTLSIEADGRIAATFADTGAKAIYDTMIHPAPLRSPETLDNVTYSARVANRADLAPADAAYADEIHIFVLSLFQRTTAFQFLCGMEPATLDRIARDLSLAQ